MAVVLLRPVALASAVVLLGCVLACVAEVCWVVVGRRKTWRRSIAPHVLRRAALGLCGVTLVVAAPATAQAGAPAGASPARPADAQHACHTLCPPSLEGLRLPDLPASTNLGATDRSRPHHATEHTVVRRGDCLWTIARVLLGPGATDAQVAHLVDDLFAGNRAQIGPDPDLVFPGTRLSTPEVIR